MCLLLPGWALARDVRRVLSNTSKPCTSLCHVTHAPCWIGNCLRCISDRNVSRSTATLKILSVNHPVRATSTLYPTSFSLQAPRFGRNGIFQIDIFIMHVSKTRVSSTTSPTPDSMKYNLILSHVQVVVIV